MQDKFCNRNPNHYCNDGLRPYENHCVCPGTSTAATNISQCDTPAPSPNPSPKPKSDAQAERDPSSPTVTDPSKDQDQANADISACQQSQSSATKCCNNPQACGAPAPQTTSPAPPAGSSGIAAYCSQLQTAALNNANANGQAASICSDNQSTCTNTCGNLVSKYQNLVSSCSDCDSASVYSSALAKLQSYNSTCNALSAQVTSLANQQIASAGSSGQSNVCNQSAAAAGGAGAPGALSPSSIGQGGNSALASTAQDPTALCPYYPNAPGCAKPTIPVAPPPQKSTAGFGALSESSGANSPSKFAVNSLTDVINRYNPFGAGVPPAAAAQVKAIPNGSGAGIPGTSGGNSAGVTPSTGRATQAPHGGGVKADILNGERSGGYSQTYSSTNDSSRGGGSSYYGAGRATASLPLDLKSYLPGGLHSRVAGYRDVRAQILGPGEDLWLHITDRINERCRLGQLLECR